MKESVKIIFLVGILVLFGAILYRIANFEPKESTTVKELNQYQQHLDSIKAYTTHITDSLTTINVEYKAKIEAKNEVIRTLKGLVNDNNKKYQVITDSALVVELEKERLKGIR